MLARTLDVSGLNAALLRLQAAGSGPHIRALNYHDVPVWQADAFEAQLRFFSDRFVPVGLDDLTALLDGTWHHPKPGLILSFDDGVRSHAAVVAPLLEKYGFAGWFFVPAGFIDTPAERQAAYAEEHNISAGGADAGEPPALTWDEIRDLDRRHVIGCHTLHHERLRSSLTEEELEREIVVAKQRLEGELGRPLSVFAWVGGEEWAYSAAAAAMIRKAGFRISFMTNSAVIRPGNDPFQLQRTNVEASYPASLTRFQLSGFMDLVYAGKRRRSTG